VGCGFSLTQTRTTTCAEAFLEIAESLWDSSSSTPAESLHGRIRRDLDRADAGASIGSSGLTQAPQPRRLVRRSTRPLAFLMDSVT